MSMTVIRQENLILHQRIIRRNVSDISKVNQVIQTFMIGSPAADLCHRHNFTGSENYRAIKTIQVPALE